MSFVCRGPVESQLRTTATSAIIIIRYDVVNWLYRLHIANQNMSNK